MPPDLKPILLSLSQGLPPRDKLTRLVFICRSIAESLLRTCHRQTTELLYSHGWSLYDLSLDCLGELFARDASGHLYKFESFLQNLDRPPHQLSDLSLFLALKAYINQFTLFRLSKLLGEADPEGRRISRNIRDAIGRKNAPLRLVRDLQGEMLMARKGRQCEKLPEFPIDLLERQLQTVAEGSISVRTILDAVARILASQTSYRKTVRLIDLIQIIKRMHARLFFQDRDGETALQPVPDGDLYVLRRSAIRFAAQKIDTTYFRKKKISEREALGLLMVVTAILDEWFGGEEDDANYYEHAKRELRCTEEEYSDRWAARIHYLVKTTRGFLADQMEG